VWRFLFSTVALVSCPWLKASFSCPSNPHCCCCLHYCYCYCCLHWCCCCCCSLKWSSFSPLSPWAQQPIRLQSSKPFFPASFFQPGFHVHVSSRIPPFCGKPQPWTSQEWSTQFWHNLQSQNRRQEGRTRIVLSPKLPQP